MSAIKFDELTEDEFEDYVSNFQDKSETTTKERLSERLDTIQSGLLRNHGSLKKVVTALNNDEKDMDLFSELTTIAKSISRKADQIYGILLEYGITQKEEHTETITEIADVHFRSFEDTLIIELPELLPHRPSFDTVRKKMNYYYDYAKWKTKYEAAFRREYEYGKFKIYNNKVCMIFLHHYDKTRKTYPDPDNLETKAIIDIIALYVIRDDSYKFMSHYVDVVEDDRDFTEIIVCPLEKLHDYI